MDTFVVQGTFDVNAAKALVAAIEPIPSSLAARVDFSRVREFHAFALATFAEWLVRSGRRVSALGLRHHEIRLLLYLGAGAHVLGVSTPVAAADAP